MRVFLDIGAHTGETLKVVTDPRWRFDRIYSFEPAPACWPAMQAVATPAVQLCRFGLWDRNQVLALHNAGAIGASLSKDKEPESDVIDCEFRDAGVWFKDNLDPDDTIFAKINVEGAESELVARLASTGTLGYIDHLLIHFDVRKVPSKRHLEGVIRQELDAAGVNYIAADEIQFGGVYRGTRNWLAWATSSSPFRDLRRKRLARIEHRARRLVWPIKRRFASR